MHKDLSKNIKKLNYHYLTLIAIGMTLVSLLFRPTLLNLGGLFVFVSSGFIYISLCTLSCVITCRYLDSKWRLYSSVDNLLARKKFMRFAVLFVSIAWLTVFSLLHSTPQIIIFVLGFVVFMYLNRHFFATNKLISIFRGFSVLLNGSYAPGVKNSLFIMSSFVDEEIRGEVINLTPFEVTIQSEKGTHTYPNHRIEYFSKARVTHMDGVRIEVSGIDKKKIAEDMKCVKKTIIRSLTLVGFIGVLSAALCLVYLF